MNIKLNITLNDCEGALVRLLGTVERRGHKLLQLSSGICPGNAGARALLLDVDCGSRSPDVLVRQIRRLYDVLSAAWYQRPEMTVDNTQLSYEATVPAMYGLVVRESGSEAEAKSPARATDAQGQVRHG